MASLRRALDWTFRSRIDGRITVGQWPNLPLWLFIGFTALGFALDPAGTLGRWVRAGAALSLTWWALDEVLRGVNPWRRFLGAAVLVGEVALWGMRGFAV